MTCIYTVITAGAIIDDGTRFHNVYVGKSERQVALLARLHDVCDANGWFCAIRSLETEEFKNKIAESMGWHMTDVMARTESWQVADWLNQYEHYPDATPAPELNRSTAGFLASIDPNFYCYRRLAKIHPHG